MPKRYEYDLDHNGEWRWIAVSDSGRTAAISPVGYAHLQDCMHAVALMQVPGNFSVVPSAAQAEALDTPDGALSRLSRRPSAA